MNKNLSRMGQDVRWLGKQLKAQEHKEAKESFLGIYHPEEDSLPLYPCEE